IFTAEAVASSQLTGDDARTSITLSTAIVILFKRLIFNMLTIPSDLDGKLRKLIKIIGFNESRSGKSKSPLN
ncbi:MAG TPA: hypothetical protein PLE02_06305, partial [Bacteroidales bacterium]|nr:hypothetical protein [Bacteroidales bacterium]